MNEDNRLSENEFQEAPQPSPEKPKRAKRVIQLTWGKLTGDHRLLSGPLHRVRDRRCLSDRTHQSIQRNLSGYLQDRQHRITGFQHDQIGRRSVCKLGR